MFASVGRRLALLNVAVVVVVIAIVGLGTYLLLRESLDREADQALEDRIAAAEDAWAPLLTGETEGSAAQEGDDDDEEHEEEDESHEILASGDILLFLFDARGELIANDRDVRLEGIPLMAGVDTALSGETDTHTVTIDGESIRVRTEPVEEHGDVVGAIQATRSERQHDEELELVGLASLVGIGLGTLIALPAGLFLARRAMRPIDAAFSRQRAFVADASHELRTPLTVLRANAEMVRRLPDPVPGEIRDEMDQMLGEIDRMTDIVNDMLALARYGDGSAGVELGPVDIAAAIEAVVRSLRHQAEDASVAIEVEATPRLTATASRALVEQVVRIALDNAIRYTTAGDTVSVTATRRGETVRICVRDHGPGIDPADQPYVFDRFYRTDPARSRNTGGTGLGLPIARSLVQALGGGIELESAPGEGTEVCVTLPAAT